MDLLFKRYASPFPFLDGMLNTGRFFDFICEFWKIHIEETDDKKTWEFYLHRVENKSFNDFVEGLKIDKENQEMTPETMEATVKNSLEILGSFNPEE